MLLELIMIISGLFDDGDDPLPCEDGQCTIVI